MPTEIVMYPGFFVANLYSITLVAKRVKLSDI